MRNTSGKPWPEGTGGELRIGARLFRQPANGEPVREFRAALAEPPASGNNLSAFQLLIEPGDLEDGRYELSIDVVKEQQFWMAEKGATPSVIQVVIG